MPQTVSEAEKILAKHPQPFVIKNPLCSPTSPIHTILCETVEDTRAWLRHVNYAEGVFLQEYLGRAEAGHIVLVSGGEIYSLVTNQEYKYAFNGNQGVVAGAPLGGLVERDPNDKYGLARKLIHPLLPWLRAAKFNGPLQVTAVKRGRSMARHRIQCPHRRHLRPDDFADAEKSGGNRFANRAEPKSWTCSSTKNSISAVRSRWPGYGYPFIQVRSPHLPLEVDGKFDCDVWWNEVARGADKKLMSTGHRIADVIALAPRLDAAIARAYANIRKIRVVGQLFPDGHRQKFMAAGNGLKIKENQTWLWPVEDEQYVASSMLGDRLITGDEEMARIANAFRDVGLWKGTVIFVDPNRKLEDLIPAVLV